MGYELGVDLGTTYTAAATLGDGRLEIASLGVRTLQVPSVAFVLDDGQVLVGEPAERRSLTGSDRFAREFKRRLGDPTPILLGGTPFSAQSLTARLLRATVTIVSERNGAPPDHTVVTCPASWSDYKRGLLEQAIHEAGIGPAGLASEPEAAAVYYASTNRVRSGDVIAVYDLGGGTFDAAVLRAGDQGDFELLGVPQGLEQAGGVQFDDAVFAYVTRLIADELALLDPDDPATVTALVRLRRECVEAKEALSSDTEVRILVTLPNWQTEVYLTRSHFESMIRPALSDTIDTLRRTLRSADLLPEEVTAVLLVGGSSRIPLVAELLASELGRPTAVDVHPKHAVALGAARLAATAAGRPLPRPSVAAATPEPPEPAVAPSPPMPEPAFDDPPPDPALPPPAAGGPRRRGRAVLVVGVVAVLLVLGASLWWLGNDDSGGDGGVSAGTSDAPARLCREVTPAEGGGELIDYTVFNGGMPDDVDPARNVTPASAQVVDALYDGLTTVDGSDPDEPPRVRRQVAESYETNGDASVWTFTIREGLQFSNGEPVQPSSFVRAWERASDPDVRGGDAFVFGAIDGGWEKLDGQAGTLAGVQADDEARTLTVELDAPYADFDALVGYQPFMPLPEAVEALDSQGAWDDGVMIGNGPFVMDEPRGPRGISLSRNPRWNGTCYDPVLDLPQQPEVATIRLRTGGGSGAGFGALTDGTGQVAVVPPPSRAEADESQEHTFDAPLLSTTFLAVNADDPVVGGPENQLLRQAISQAIDREALDVDVFGGTSRPASGVTPPVVPGFASELCDHCDYDPDAAREAFEEWQDEGNELAQPLRLQSSAAPGRSEPVVAQVVEDLVDAGIPAVEERLGAGYLEALRDGGCQVCLVNRSPPFLSYDSLLYDLFHSDSIGRSNHGRLADDNVDEHIYAAREVPEAGERMELYRSAERRLLNDLVTAVPLLWSGAPYAYAGGVESLPLNGLGHVIWERVGLSVDS